MPWLRSLLQELWLALLPTGLAECDALEGTDTPHVQKPSCAEPLCVSVWPIPEAALQVNH